MDQLTSYLASLPLLVRLATFAGVAVGTHLTVIGVRHLAAHFTDRQVARRNQKLSSIATLASSAIVFALYFFAFGLMLRELGVSLTAYLASASVVGLAVGFGSQGIVQDVVTGLTLIFSDLVDVGDLVEISGQTGIVRAITMRFVRMENAMGATVFVPNRTISNITNYPKGYVRCIVDVTLSGEEETRQKIEAAAVRLMAVIREQFPGLLIAPPSSEGRIRFDAGKEIVRLKFRIWPDRGEPIETLYQDGLTAELKALDPDYQDWMISISYEVEGQRIQPEARWRWRRTSNASAAGTGDPAKEHTER